MKDKLLSGGGIITALLASLCCITPVLAVLGGLGGIATTFSFLEPLRPHLIGLTVIVLGYAFYKAYKPKKNTDIDCACEGETNGKKVSFINSKKFLWIITAISALLITFPYYSKVLFPAAKENVVIVQSDNIVKAEIHIEGMTCTSCENYVDFALKSEAGVIKESSSYKTGIAKVEFDKTKVTEDQLKKAIEEKVGYKVKEIKAYPNPSQREGLF